jgi:GT2 family glycosyltransferase/SAM-dependent methyltransferase
MGEIFERVMPLTALEWTGERLTTAVGGQVEIEHLHRYFLARHMCRGMDVLDVASGEGYGSAFLAQTARSVVGIELSVQSATHAKASYHAPNLHFVVADARNIPLPNACLDIVVSFETIEHFFEHDCFMREVRRVLRPRGRLVISTPERDVYSPFDTAPNPYHLRELSRVEFVRLLSGTFKHVVLKGQRPLLGSALVAEQPMEPTRGVLTFERRGPTHFESSEGVPRPIYLLANASDSPITHFPDSLYLESNGIDELLGQRLEIELHGRDAALAEAGTYARKLEADLETTRAALEAAHAALAEAGPYARKLEAELEATRAALETARAEQRQHSIRAGALEVEMRARDAALAEATPYARKLEAELRASNEALGEAGPYARKLEVESQARNATLEKVLMEHHQLGLRLEATLRSTSWRITTPLRATRHIVRRAITFLPKIQHSSHSVELRPQFSEERPAPKNMLVESCSLETHDQVVTSPARTKLPTQAKTGLADSSTKAQLADQAKRELADFLSSSSRLAFFDGEAPEVSVLVVLWNQAHLTLRCLQALQREIRTGAPLLELVLVDNASSEETIELLSRLDGVRIIQNAENVGFVRACNQAAAIARGVNLLFLNNDACVRPGALKAAYSTLNGAPDIGAVGGRLILPSGLLQEAGSIIWSDGSTLGYGRGLAANAGEAMFRREVDYCSAAFLMTPRVVWETLGGFDECYSPAYYEETDYCMRIWKVGLRVVYEPAAAIDHYEFGSSANIGEPITTSLINRKRFRTRHAESLRRSHLPAAPDNVLAARAHRVAGRRQLLVLDNEVPLRALGSGYPRMSEMLLQLSAAGWLISFFPLQNPNVDWAAARAEVPWEIEILSDRKSEALKDFLEERQGYYDVILVSRPDNMALFRRALRERPHLTYGTRLIYDAEALFASRTIAEAALEGRPLPSREVDRIVDAEIELAVGADAVISVTEAEAQVFRDRLRAPVHILGHAIEPRFNAPGFEGRNGFIFVGRLLEQHAPNWRGLRWFIREAWPLIRGKLPQAELTVAGYLHADCSALEGEGVRLVGPVADLNPLYAATRVFLAPVQFAAGLPIKILEATVAGLPTAATMLMARQLGWIPNVEIAAADSPAALAAAAVILHEKSSVWSAMRDAARYRVAREYSPDIFRSRLSALLDGERPLRTTDNSQAVR